MRTLCALLLHLLTLSSSRALAASPDSNDIHDAKQLAALHKAIVAADYVCPSVKIASVKGVVAEGTKIKVWCGPADDSKNVYTNLIYIVLIRPSGRTEVTKGGLIFD